MEAGAGGSEQMMTLQRKVFWVVHCCWGMRGRGFSGLTVGWGSCKQPAFSLLQSLAHSTTWFEVFVPYDILFGHEQVTVSGRESSLYTYTSQ